MRHELTPLTALFLAPPAALQHHFNREFDRQEVAPQVGYDARLRLVRAWQDDERAAAWTIESASCEYSNLALLRDSYPGFLDQIAAIDSPAVKAAARLLRQQYDARIAPGPQRPRVFPRPTPAAKTSKVVFHKLELSVDGRKILDGSVASARRLWIRGTGGVDITWTAQDVTVINSEGQVRTLYKAGEAGLASVCYDGRYVWGLLPLRGESPVVVIEPHSGRVIHFTAGDRLPPMTQGAVAAAIAPGSICIAGGIGKEPPQQGLGRGWIALVGIDVARKRSVDLVHEARIHTDKTNETREDQFNPNLAFQPAFMFTLRDPGDPANVRLLLSRRTGGWNSSSRPLLIDPRQKSVKVLDLFLPTHLTGKDYTCHDGTLYWASRSSGSDNYAALWHLGFPDFRPMWLGELPDSTGGIPVFFNGRVHVFGQTWYVSSDEGRSFSTMNAKAPGTHFLRYLCTSHHDGLILLANNGGLFDHYRVDLSSQESD